MERMLRKNKNNEYEIDRELTGKFAIEKNAEYQDRIAELEEENKKLKELRAYADNLDSENDEQALEIEELKKENKKLKEELSKYKKQYLHSMGFMEEDTLQELKDIGEI